MDTREAGQLRSEVVSKTAFLYVSMLANAALGYAALFLSLRYVGELEYAVLAFALSFEGVFLFITDMGFARSHTKKVSEGCDLGECLSVFAFIRILLSVIYTAVILGSMFIWEFVLDNHYENADTSTVLLIVLAYNVIVSLRWTYVYTFYAKREVAKGQAVMLSEVVVRFLGTAAVVIVGGGAIGLSTTFAVAAVASMFVAIALGKTALPRIGLLPLRRDLLSDYTRFALPIALAIACGTVALYLDKVIIEWSLSSEDTGAFFASQRLLAVYVSLGSAVSVVVFPSISRLNSMNSGTDHILSIISTTIKTLSIAVIPLTCFLAVYSEDIVTVLLSPNYIAVALPFSILAISYGLFILTTPFQSQMLGMGYASEYSRYSIVYGLVIILLDFVLIPEEILGIRLPGLGLMGAAIALLAAQVVSTSMFYMSAIRISGFAAPRGLVVMVAFSLASAGLSLSADSLLSIDGFAGLVIEFSIFIFSVLTLFLFGRIIRMSDILKIRQWFT